MPDTALEGSTTWIRRFHPAPGAGARVVCFPHAGGSASFYRPVSTALRPGIEVLTVQYPGRQDRRAEQPFTDLRTLADRTFDALEPWLDSPLALFGHSMGALIAYEIALRMERESRPPTVLIASGRRAPSLGGSENVHRRDDNGIVAEIKRLSGTDARLLDDPEMLRAVLPAVRADYQAVETYTGDPGAALSCPVEVFAGDNDSQVTAEQARAWHRHAAGNFTVRWFSGGHFYLTEQPAAVIERLGETVRSYS
ncbi:thioesterase II family protein [Streptomyces phaeochromogenes]|uniref:thioesterase II family protein n=1 Tax=Streptomyces phaeochromogenes TaxID=1923 RepID=UPI003699CE7B